MIKTRDTHRVKYCSIVLQPVVKDFDWSKLAKREIEKKLMELSFPIFTEVTAALNKLKAESVNNNGMKKLISWAYGSETGDITKCPHYQIFVEFEVMVKKSSVYEELGNLLPDRCHIITQKAYNDNYVQYCTKDTSNFEFDGKYYWNVKLTSEGFSLKENKIHELRPKLKMVKNNLYTGQILLQKMISAEPDDRTGIWLADVIGSTGKTAFFQSELDDKAGDGCYLRVSDGVERLSSKLRKKINHRLATKQGYPKWIWVNFGRTVEETSLKAFADFGEQILDGMLDDNFGNSASQDFMPLPYVNLIVTANTPPNLKQLTGDRLKLLTLFPIYKEKDSYELEDSLLIPIFVEIRVRVMKSTMRNILQYRYIVRIAEQSYIKASFGNQPYYDQLIENVSMFEEFRKSDKWDELKYDKKLQTDWEFTSPHNLQKDIYNVYGQALDYSSTVTGSGSGQSYIETSSFRSVQPRHYNVQKAHNEYRKYETPNPINVWDNTFN